MRKHFRIAAGLLALVLCITVALAAGGDAGDPLVSLSYLQDLFSQTVDTAAGNRMDEADTALQDTAQQRLDAMSSAVGAAAGQQYAPSLTEVTWKEGDALTGATGLLVIPFTGDLQASFGSGAIIDVTAGTEIPSGTTLTANHRYIVAENTVAHFTVLSPTAVLSFQGKYAQTISGSTPDYFAISCALRNLGLFRGTGSGIGEGFDLHLAPTRAEGIVMFIRIMGEEADALSCEYTHPFRDVPGWLDRYVAWAYHQGYTNGVSATAFGTQQTISAVEYQEFLLRALGYSVAGVHDYTTSLSRALECGAISSGEYDMLQQVTFLRAHVAYISYYSLDVMISGTGRTLSEHLRSLDIFTRSQLASARALVNSPRVI